MLRSWLDRTLVRQGLWALLAVAGTAWAQTPDPEPPSAPAEPVEPWDGEPGPARPAAPSAPDMDCYQAARQRQGDAYVCDLAVQMARDGASRAGLAAALANRALVLAREGRLDPALEDLNAALAQTPDDPALHGNLGNLLLRLGRPRDALAAHDRAVELAPRDARGYYNRAFSYLALADTVRAEQDVAAARALLARRRLPVSGAEAPAPDDGRSR